MKWILLILTLVFALILTGTAAAADTTGSTNISSASNLNTFNINQIIDASSQVKTYIDNNNGTSLPNNVTIGNQIVTMPQFLYLMASAVILINNNNLNGK